MKVSLQNYSSYNELIYLMITVIIKNCFLFNTAEIRLLPPALTCSKQTEASYVFNN